MSTSPLAALATAAREVMADPNVDESASTDAAREMVARLSTVTSRDVSSRDMRRVRRGIDILTALVNRDRTALWRLDVRALSPREAHALSWEATASALQSCRPPGAPRSGCEIW